MNESYVLLLFMCCHSIPLQTTTAWKCYRCDVTFTKESISAIHKDISHHPIRKVSVLLAA
ncbi:MAG: hypothetical protein OEW86_05475 [Nitrosopumilus sp.]|nr:hypothetical protein [Nitrosopumilus sp.]